MMGDFRCRLKIAMQRKNIKSIELAEKIGCSRSLISQYLSGKCQAKQIIIYRMANVLGVTPSWLMGLNEDDEINKSLLNNINSILNSLNEQQLDQVLQMLNVMFPKGSE